MNRKVIQKKVVRAALKSSGICRKKYFDTFFRKGRQDITMLYSNGQNIGNMLKQIEIKPFGEGRFAHQINDKYVCFYCKDVIGNMPPNYELVIHNSIQELKRQNQGTKEIEKQNYEVLCAVEKHIDRIKAVLREQNPEDKRIVLFDNMKDKPATTLEDALQRILLWSSIFWQTGHKLVGLGRLDKLLSGIDEKRNADEVVDILLDFINELHQYYEYKSAQLLGDIGQIIILGGLDNENEYFCNSYTYRIIDAIKRANVTDPKILLRVSEKMPRDLLEKSVDCLVSANGSPLFSNDDIVVKCLMEFGYDEDDAYNYVTSACWEPVSYGNSLEQNNLDTIKYANAFVEAMKDEACTQCDSFEDFLQLYQKHLRNEIQDVLSGLEVFDWENDPLYTLFTSGCKESNLDISKGGAKYNDYGVLSVGMGNAVNSIINIKRKVFEEKSINLANLHNIWVNGSDDEIEQLSQDAKNMPKSFGHDEKESIEIANRLLEVTNSCLRKYRNRYDGKIKAGLSAPGYIIESKSAGLTYDGRLPQQPLSVHISGDDGVAYTELISFASQLNYCGEGANGNVADYFVSPDFLKKNKEKFVDFLRLSIKQGFYQMQMNVMSSDTLINAKKNPKEYGWLIVRVWGFSAYFNDLPVEYQDLLIERALRSEGKAS